MDKEVDDLKAIMGGIGDAANPTVEEHAGMQFWSGTISGQDVVLVRSGIGKVNAAVGASELIRNYHPDYLISSGCAGGLDAQLKVMDVIASTSTIYHDIVIGEAGEGLDIERPYPSDTYLINQASALSKTSPVTIHLGQICTGDQFITEREKLELIKQRFPEGLAVDMESCAIAQTCKIYGVPFISFRIISDTIGAELHVEEYQNFWAEMADHSFELVKAFIEQL